ncbi:hypothetical protein ON058_09485 [Demequina sp. B12]|uniref:hypothetical protein n=1 Tax=Demequina sp. B12 TaxID=2992757 RepID=UPI00237A9558|nr:hypothetical protein [Demequina sp. B12]MDE0573644.1 hypothetical protein [Demequina sp. B12]
MIRRIAALGAAVALTLGVPVAAVADEYPAPEADLECSTQQTPVVTDFTCTVFGEEGDDAQIQTEFDGADATIAGAQVSEVKTIVDGKATWTVHAPDVTGPITIVGYTAEVAIDTTATVMVIDAGVDSGAEDGTGSEASNNLPATGASNSAPLIVGSVVLVAAGTFVVIIAVRRRRREQEA